jgi:hypothetical protein
MILIAAALVAVVCAAILRWKTGSLSMTAIERLSVSVDKLIEVFMATKRDETALNALADKIDAALAGMAEAPPAPPTE